MARSIRSTALFKDEDDYQVFYMLLKKSMEKYPYDIHSYCLMTTHFHMLITTQTDEIWKIMNYILHSYAVYFNRKYDERGHVFDSRYTSSIVENDLYFLEVSRYIHLNPVRANMVKHPIDYEHSSYNSFIYGKDNDLLQKQEVLKYFAGNQINEYKEFVENAIS